MRPYSPDAFRDRPALHQAVYDDPRALDRVLRKLRSLPPLVTSWEIERLKALLADAEAGKRFVLMGGDCAETIADCRPDIVVAKLKILLQMSLVLIHGGQRPIVRVARIAGQYAKPRSSPTETRSDVELPTYVGDLVNRPEFTAEARRHDPELLLAGYEHAAITLNFVRSLTERGFADLHHPEYWDLSFFARAGIGPELREEYERTSRGIAEALRFMEALGEGGIDDLSRVELYTSHEGLHLEYERAQTRTVPRREGCYCLTTHLPWIGDRTRALDGGHVELFRGVENPVGVKLGPSATPAEAVALAETLDPRNRPGKLVFIARMGAAAVAEKLPPLVEAVKNAGRRVLWLCDPMHGNTKSTKGGKKTRDFDDILREIEASFGVHESLGGHLGGVHFELTGDDVTECIGGGLTERDLDVRYESACDPRLNYRQSLEMAFRLAKRMRR